MHLVRLLVAALFALSFWAQSTPDFERDVQPVFRKRCSGCHGTAQQLSGFRLDDREAAMKGGYSGVVIKPGDSAGSALVQRLKGEKNLMAMPPGDKRLSSEELAIVRGWIDAGAKWPDALAKPKAGERRSTHWAFQAVKRPSVPAVKDTKWARNPIDNFVLARLE